MEKEGRDFWRHGSEGFSLHPTRSSKEKQDGDKLLRETEDISELKKFTNLHVLKNMKNNEKKKKEISAHVGAGW